MVLSFLRRVRHTPAAHRSHRDSSAVRRPFVALLPILIACVLSTAGAAYGQVAAYGQGAADTVYVVQIRGEIDLGLPPYLGRVLEEADNQNASAVVLEINTPGGRLDAALHMRDLILDSDVRTIAFVNREAFSAGALIAIASRDIYMAPGAVMGAATPVEGTGEPADEKVISAVRKTFKSTAEIREREPIIAEAMVDPSVHVEGLVEEEQLLTLTATEAHERGYAESIVRSLGAALEAAGLNGAELRNTTPSLAENAVRFLTSPIIASLLFSLGLLLLIGDVFTEGFGLPGLAGLALLSVFFWGHYLAGLAGWEGVALVILGLVLMGVEVLVIPGFGVVGILGATALLAGLFMSLVSDRLVTNQDLLRAGYTMGIMLLFITIGLAVLLRYLPSLGRFQGLVLQSAVGVPDVVHEVPQRRWRRASEQSTRPPAQARDSRSERGSLLGARGTAISDLRPGGFAEIVGERVDVVTRGDYIGAGEPVEVIADEGYRRVVRRVGEGEGSTKV